MNEWSRLRRKKVKLEKKIEGKGRQAATVVSISNSSIKYTLTGIRQLFSSSKDKQRYPIAVQQQRQAAISGSNPAAAKADRDIR
ncbi:hypothetical protein TNIN_473611 [Trichonephila inaurata madagascariensis]|uniref:Uncharacterized protein n=1 Tax=Trichonephila inaurata madagascariensis TaxID=2747483 RepID=A0A8X7BSV3_9ARAC|nr:hypothetical protein TNIN_473611 [Trichonephila inaurata madagascariensis]